MWHFRFFPNVWSVFCYSFCFFDFESEFIAEDKFPLQSVVCEQILFSQGWVNDQDIHNILTIN